MNVHNIILISVLKNLFLICDGCSMRRIYVCAYVRLCLNSVCVSVCIYVFCICLLCVYASLCMCHCSQCVHVYQVMCMYVNTNTPVISFSVSMRVKSCVFMEICIDVHGRRYKGSYFPKNIFIIILEK